MVPYYENKQQRQSTLMSGHFMQNLTEEIVRQNHKLKDQILQLKHKLKDYEQQIVETITMIQPQYDNHDKVEQMLLVFVKSVRDMYGRYSELRGAYERVSGEVEHVKEENIGLVKEIQQRSADDQQNIQIWESERAQLAQHANTFKNQTQILKQNYQKLKTKFNHLHIQKLKIQESKRQQIQQTCLQHHVELMTIKNKTQREHLKVQRMLREQIENKNQTVKDLSMCVKNMQKEASQSAESSPAFMEMFKKLEEYNKLSHTINEIRTQNAELRQAKKDLENNKVIIEAKLKESKYNEQKIGSQMQRASIYLQEVEGKLTQKTQELLKSQKDKEQMDKYYDQRWVDEYKRVKNRMAKDFMKKINEIQQNYNNKLAVFESRMFEAISIKNKTLKRNQQLQEIFQLDQKTNKELNQHIDRLSLKLGEFRMIVRETQFMMEEEILVLRGRFEDEKLKLRREINQAEKGQLQITQELQQFKTYHQKTMNQTNRQHQIYLQEQRKQHQLEKRNLQSLHKHELNKLLDEIAKSSKNAQSMKQMLEEQYLRQMQIQKKRFNQELMEKQRQNQRKHDKWVDKFHQMDNLHNQAKQKLQRSLKEVKKDLQTEQDKNKDMRKGRQQLFDKIDTLNNVIKQWKDQNKKMEQKIEQKNGQLNLIQVRIHNLQGDLDENKKQVQVLVRMRKQWKNELSSLQFDYKQEFAALKKQFDRERTLLKQKVMELQNLNKRKAVNRKEYEELKELHQQKQNLKEQVHVRQAENIILTQIKDYYQTQLQQHEQEITKTQLRDTHSILTRRIKRGKIKTRKDSVVNVTNRVITRPKEEQIPDSKRYTMNQYNRQFNYSLSKAKLQQFPKKHYRVKTSYAL